MTINPRVWIGCIVLVSAMTPSVAAENRCWVNTNTADADQRWTATMHIERVQVLGAEGLLRVHVRATEGGYRGAGGVAYTSCNPGDCARLNRIDVRIPTGSGVDASEFRAIKSIIFAAYTRSSRVRFRLAEGTCSGTGDDSYAVADGVSIPIKTAWW